MDQGTIQMLFSLLRSAIKGTGLNEAEQENYSREMLPMLLKIAEKHDVKHLVAYALKKNGLLTADDAKVEKSIFKAAYRYEQLKYELDNLCDVLEKANIPFIPLKGSVIRRYYPEPWMRTSCDIDILIHEDDLEKATSVMIENYGYSFHMKCQHDISFFSPSGVHLELHFALIESDRVNESSAILNSVWNNAIVHKDTEYWCEMPDDMFYFYHIAHMAKHFRHGGCGIRAFLCNINKMNRI